jgi:hypothetical protein
MEDDPLRPGKDLFFQNMFKVLRRHGYEGDALEERVQKLLRSDVSRIAAIIWGASVTEATNMTIEERLAFINARQKDTTNG